MTTTPSMTVRRSTERRWPGLPHVTVTVEVTVHELAPGEARVDRDDLAGSVDHVAQVGVSNALYAIDASDTIRTATGTPTTEETAR